MLCATEYCNAINLPWQSPIANAIGVIHHDALRMAGPEVFGTFNVAEGEFDIRTPGTLNDVRWAMIPTKDGPVWANIPPNPYGPPQVHAFGMGGNRVVGANTHSEPVKANPQYVEKEEERGNTSATITPLKIGELKPLPKTVARVVIYIHPTPGYLVTLNKILDTLDLPAILETEFKGNFSFVGKDEVTDIQVVVIEDDLEDSLRTLKETGDKCVFVASGYDCATLATALNVVDYVGAHAVLIGGGAVGALNTRFPFPEDSYFVCTTGERNIIDNFDIRDLLSNGGRIGVLVVDGDDFDDPRSIIDPMTLNRDVEHPYLGHIVLACHCSSTPGSILRGVFSGWNAEDGTRFRDSSIKRNGDMSNLGSEL